MDVGASKIVEPETTEVTCPRKTYSNLGLHNTLHFPTRVMFEGILSKDKTLQRLSAKLSKWVPDDISERG